MKQILPIIELIVALLLVGVILIQPKGTGLDSAFGGTGEFYRSKRGVERIVTFATVALAVLFAVLSILLLALP